LEHLAFPREVDFVTTEREPSTDSPFEIAIRDSSLAGTLVAAASVFAAIAASFNRLRHSQPSMHEVGPSKYRTQISISQKKDAVFRELILGITLVN
jgi:hypothetical protein